MRRKNTPEQDAIKARKSAHYKRTARSRAFVDVLDGVERRKPQYQVDDGYGTYVTKQPADSLYLQTRRHVQAALADFHGEPMPDDPKLRKLRRESRRTKAYKECMVRFERITARCVEVEVERRMAAWRYSMGITIATRGDVQPVVTSVVPKPEPEITTPAATGPKHGEVGHKMKVGTDAWVEVVGDHGTPSSLWFHSGRAKKRRNGETEYEYEDSVSPDAVPSANSPEWVQRYWGEVYLGPDYDNSEKSLKKPSVYANIIDSIVGDAIEYGEDDPSALPEDVHPRIEQFWRECVRGIRDEIEAVGEGEQTPARRAGAVYARERGLRGLVQWSDAEQRFVFMTAA